MFLLELALFLMPLVLSQENLELTLTKDNYTYLSKNGWNITKNKDISVFEESLTVLREKNENCLKIPIYLIKGSLFKLNVYSNIVNDKSGIVVGVYLEDGELIQKVDLRLNHGDDDGLEIVMQINTTGAGFITIRGNSHSQDKEIVIIDSIQYLYNITRYNTDKILTMNNEESVENRTIVKELKAKITQKNGLHINKEEFQNYKTEEKDKVRNKRALNTVELGPWVIGLIVIACVTFIALVAISAYHLGKIASRPNQPEVLYLEEPPKVEMIQRVKGTVDQIDAAYNYL